MNSTLFNFLRISGRGLPLISTLTINSVENSLNGIDIGCTSLAHNFESVVATVTTTISIVNESYYNSGMLKESDDVF